MPDAIEGLKEIIAMLDALDGRHVTVTKSEDTSTADRVLAERVAAQLNRAGGPKLGPNALI